jgi:hypothetical protein
MTRVAGLVVFALLGVAVDKPATSLGTLTNRGRTMNVSNVLVVLNQEKPELTFYLLSAEPTPKEVAKARSADNETGVMFGDGPLDSGLFQLDWYRDPHSFADPSKANVWIYSFIGPGGQKNQVQDMMPGRSVEVTLTGAVKPGSEVSLTSKGSAGSKENPVAWDLHLKGTVLSKTK